MAESSKQRAGRKGGQTVSRNRAHMAQIGRKGGQASKRRATTQAIPPNPPPAGTPEHRRAQMSEHAVGLLKAQHERIMGLYQDYETSGGDDKRWLAEKLMTELEIHSRLEEELFYPAVREKADQEGREFLSEASEEHRAVNESIEELRGLDPGNESYDAKFQDTMMAVQHHINEEERDLLPIAEEELADELEDLGIEMQKRRHELAEMLGSPSFT